MDSKHTPGPERVPSLARLAAAAAGTRDQDELLLENSWARVAIVRDGAVPCVWCVSGDTKRGPLAFPSMHGALSYALESLALYEAGRAGA